MRNTIFLQTLTEDFENGIGEHAKRVHEKEGEIQKTYGMKLLSSTTTIVPCSYGVGKLGLLYLTTFLVED